jgi:hypothetical protein
LVVRVGPAVEVLAELRRQIGFRSHTPAQESGRLGQTLGSPDGGADRV